MKTIKNKHQKNAKNPAEEKPKPVFTTMIDVYPDMSVGVRNFPADDMQKAMQILAAGMIAIANHFRKQSDDKNLNRIIQLSGQQLAQAKKAMKN